MKNVYLNILVSKVLQLEVKMDILHFLVETGFWIATIRMATPLIFGTLGELICERAGVLNLGIEGIMAAGCMAGWTWVYFGGDLWSPHVF